MHQRNNFYMLPHDEFKLRCQECFCLVRANNFQHPLEIGNECLALWHQDPLAPRAVLIGEPASETEPQDRDTQSTLAPVGS